jgi:hypothetical protein
LNNGRVKAVTAAAVSSIPSSAIPAGRSGIGTEPHHRSRPLLFQGTRSSTDDKLTDDLLHSPVLPSRTQSQLVETELPIPVEAAVWDWQAPAFGASTQLGISDQSSTYFYEPQGELLLNQSASTASARAGEFNIPGPVAKTADNRQSILSRPRSQIRAFRTVVARVSVRSANRLQIFTTQRRNGWLWTWERPIELVNAWTLKVARLRLLLIGGICLPCILLRRLLLWYCLRGRCFRYRLETSCFG